MIVAVVRLASVVVVVAFNEKASIWVAFPRLVIVSLASSTWD